MYIIECRHTGGNYVENGNENVALALQKYVNVTFLEGTRIK